MKKNFVKSRWFFTMLLFVTTMIMPSMMLAQESITPTRPKGNGRAEPYQISNREELYWFARLVNGTLENVVRDKYANAILTANIIVNTGVLDAVNKGKVSESDFIEWEPIGKHDSYDDVYTGTFDGQGYTISGLYFNDTKASYVGLFGYIGVDDYGHKGKIFNVGVSDSYFQFDKQGGGVCGLIDYRGVLQNCSNSSTVIGKNNDSRAGGVCGDNNGTVRDCKNTGSVSGQNDVGGVCGFSAGTVKSCYNTGSVHGTGTHVGGVCGSNYIGTTYSGTITNCYYLENTATGGMEGKDVPGKAEKMSIEPFKSGEMAWLLNGKGLGEQVWGQQLGIDPSPVPGSAYKVIKAAQGDKDANGHYTYWATFSNLKNDVTLSVPSESGRTLNVYNATVSGGKLTLTQRSDDQVAKGEGVLLKTDGEYVNAKANEKNVLEKASPDENHLVATPAVAETVTAETGYILYRLTYKNDTNKEGLGFYLGVDKANNIIDGTRLKATPGKAYLKVSENAAKAPSSAALTRSFVFGSGSETTGIDGITIMGTDVQRHGTIEGIFDLQGRKISNPTKGIYIKNNKKVIIK